METKYIKTNYGNYPLKSFKPVCVSKEAGSGVATYLTNWKCDGGESYEWYAWIFDNAGCYMSKSAKDTATIIAMEGYLDFVNPHEIYFPDKKATNNYDYEAAEKRIRELRDKRPKTLNEFSGHVVINVDGEEMLIPPPLDSRFQYMLATYERWAKDGFPTFCVDNYTFTLGALSKLLFLNEEETKEYFTLSFLNMIHINPADKLNLARHELGKLFKLARRFNDELKVK